MSDEYVYPAHLDPQRAKLPQTTNYLDDVQRREAEVQRARVEGREPDLENPPATSSTPLVKAGRLFDHPRNTLDRTLAKPVVLGEKPKQTTRRTAK